MLGRLVSDAGGAYRIAHTLIDKFGNKRIQLAVVLASFIIGIALFFEVGMVLLIPIIFAIAAESLFRSSIWVSQWLQPYLWLMDSSHLTLDPQLLQVFMGQIWD